MNGEFKIGAVLHYRDFEFEDGTIRDKFMVVLGAKPDCDYLCALTTSKQWILKAERCCHHTPRTYFFIPEDKKHFFEKDTWIVLSDPVMMSRAKVMQKGMTGKLKVRANLNQNITEEIRNCLKASRDISERYRQLL